MKKLFLIFFALAFISVSGQEESGRRKEVFDRGMSQNLFVPRGQVFFGGAFSYFNGESDDLQFLSMVTGVRAKGYNFSASPFAGYFLWDNIAVGGRFKYGRTELRLDNTDIGLGDDLSFNLKDFYYIDHSYTGSAFIRTYLSLGDSRIFALFNEVRVSLGGGQGKITNGTGQTLKGTYQTSFTAELGLAPGLIAFISNAAAAEVSIGVLGLKYHKLSQITNQVDRGQAATSSGSFKINLLAINIGMSFYIPI